VLPLLLGALALRFLIPAGFMPGSAEGITLTVAMCSTGQDQNELIEIPGKPAQPHCEHCTAPTIGAPLAPFVFTGLPADPRRPLPLLQESQIPEVPLVRAQIPRAPPHA
jgi:hypothetical protein